MEELVSFNFVNEEKELFFRKNGYVILDLLDATQAESLISLYQEVQNSVSKDDNKIFATGEHLKEAMARSTSDAIEEVIKHSLANQLLNYDVLMSAFIVKPAFQEKKDYFDWHQDLSFVDEQKYLSAQLWIALRETNTNNGNIQIIEGSHVYNDVIRTAPIYPSFFHKYLERMKVSSKNISLKAGQAIIFNHKLLHASSANVSTSERLAVISSIKPKGAHWLYFVKENEQSKVLKYKADLDFYLDVWINKKIDSSKLLDSFDYSFPTMKEEQFQEWKASFGKASSFFQKIKSFLNDE